ncbi:EFR1 family ferrodoxin [Haloimpatiens sp. FM7330]|uniref:EFR1 family ferrodoxin n=1 Tax=Haloimpatiens sp. FM7330 TaxID=3298610 RepID=UPI0036404293
MKGAIIYFSATGNTEYVAELFKKEFSKSNIECDLIDIVKHNELKEEYSFYIFGAPIHAEFFPNIYIKWIEKNLKFGNNKKCMIFSTQASNRGTGTEFLSKILKQRGFEIKIQQPITMPNNYYVVGFKEASEDKKQQICETAKHRIADIVKIFLLGEKSIEKVSGFKVKAYYPIFKLFNIYAKNWAKRTISIDYNRCIKCGACAKNCPTGNINIEDGEITFNSSCISCQRCLHICPVNAFLYKKKHFKQYKIS